MAVDLQHPVDLLGDLRADLDQALGDRGELPLAAWLKVGRSGGEQHLGLENETVAETQASGEPEKKADENQPVAEPEPGRA